MSMRLMDRSRQRPPAERGAGSAASAVRRLGRVWSRVRTMKKLRRSKATLWVGIGLLLLALGIGALTVWNEVPSLRGDYLAPHPISPWSVPVHMLGLTLFLGGLI